jgi:RimJ/RimL family protein N-acetyltransferase
LRAIVDYGFADLGLKRIYGLIFGWNRASMRMVEKAGWQCEGRLRQAVTKDGITTDEFIYAVLADDRRTADLA